MKYCVELEKYWSLINTTNTCYKASGGLAATIDQKNNIAYIYGGKVPDSKTNNYLYKLDLTTETFSIITELPIEDRINHKIYFIEKNQIWIISGSSVNPQNNPKTIEIIIYDLNLESIEIFNTNIPFRGQFGSTLNQKTNEIYFYGGFSHNDFYVINIINKNVRKVELDYLEQKAGMVFEYIEPDTIFLFSGFSVVGNKSISYNNYTIGHLE